MRRKNVLPALITLTLVVLVWTSGHAPVQAVAPPDQSSQRTPLIESEHPYADNANAFWTLENNSGLNAARIHFSKIELEDGVDKIEVRDAQDVLIQEITSSAPDGLWSDIVPGAIVKVVLKSDTSGRFWGFAVDQMQPLDYLTVAYSPHPYPNDFKDDKMLINNTLNQAATRLHFDRIELEEGVDYLIIKDMNDVPYQWITGKYLAGFTSKAVPGPVIILQMVTDSSGQAWGYNVDRVEGALAADVPDEPPARQVLVESDHPYKNNFQQTWTIVNPDVNAASSKVHFSRIDLHERHGGERLYVLDVNDTLIQVIWPNTHVTDVWSAYVPGRVVKVRLVTDGEYEDWGFQLDAIVSSVAKPGLAQSDHPYAPNLDRVWNIVNPDVNAVSSKVHFSRIDLHERHGGERLYVLDVNDTLIQVFWPDTHITDVWSAYVPGRVVKVRLVTDGEYGDWGFRLDAIVSSVAKPGLAQSDHPYAPNLDRVWNIVNPDVNAVSSKVHFSRIDLHERHGRERLYVLDANDTVIQEFGPNTHLRDVWSDYVPGKLVRIRLVSDDGYEDWGFRVDDIRSSAKTPQADFVVSPQAGKAPLRVTFLNTSAGDYATSSWDFGDGFTSTLDSPVHVFALPGRYAVKLTIHAADASQLSTKTAYISVERP